VLTLLSGLMLLAMGFLRLGFLANFLSHPVISGFITASGILIAASQLKHLLGIEASGQTLHEMTFSRPTFWHQSATLVVGGTTLVFLYAVRKWLKRLLPTGRKTRPPRCDETRPYCRWPQHWRQPSFSSPNGACGLSALFRRVCRLLLSHLLTSTFGCSWPQRRR
jgi:hypothetical protein